MELRSGHRHPSVLTQRGVRQRAPESELASGAVCRVYWSVIMVDWPLSDRTRLKCDGGFELLNGQTAYAIAL